MRTSSKIKIGLSIVQVILLALMLLQLYKCDEDSVAKVDRFDVVNIDKAVQTDEPPAFLLVASALALLKLTRGA